MIDPNQILDAKIERMSTSTQEIDLDSAFILNRLQIAMTDDSNEHANPGIAFLWRDERGRRSQMSGDVSYIFPYCFHYYYYCEGLMTIIITTGATVSCNTRNSRKPRSHSAH